MSDLSLPPLSLMPQAVEEPLSTAKPAGGPFAWPTPSLPCYPAPARQRAPEPCEIEGLNGQATSGRMLSFRPDEGTVLIQLAPGRAAMPLRFEQFRCLRLSTPLACAGPVVTSGALPAALAERPAVPYTAHLKGGAVLQGLTVRHQETDYGLFLFEPIDHAGAVRRLFVPRAVCERHEIGARIGDTLIEQQSATAGQVQSALDEQRSLRQQKLGDILIARQIITTEELVQAIEQQSKMPMVRIGEALVALGMATPETIEAALAQQRGNRSVPLGELLVRRGVVSREDLQTALSRKMGYPLVDVGQFKPEAEALARIPYSVARRVPALPLLNRRGGRLVVAMEDPTKKIALDEVEFAAQCKIVPVLARVSALLPAVERAYERIGCFDDSSMASTALLVDGDGEDATKLAAALESGADPRDGQLDEDAPIEQSDNSLVRLINQMILEAQAQGVSDIHIECSPGRDKVKIRFRKDGQMRPYLELPHTHRNALIARLKIMCDLDISERRKPQDGKISFAKFVQGQKLELRVATIPTHSGLEDAVLRLLASAKAIPLGNLGLSPTNLRWLEQAMQRPYGMILCVGPTGSGKTTTLHSAVGFINSPERKIWTAEDPIEITQAGLRQVQVNPKIDWTFAKALRAFLRADPDVIMVGEIRDHETAQIAVEASLTGHLVLSTLHTNSAAETVTRLVDMGLDPFNFADSLLAVIAQRLVRRLCMHCREPREASAEELEEMLRDWLHTFSGVERAPQHDEVLASWRERFGATEGGKHRVTTYRAVGCARCDQTGFRGRAGIHELLTVTHTMRHLIQTNSRSDVLLKAALSDGMRTLRQDGIEKVLAGITTIEEVRANSN